MNYLKVELSYKEFLVLLVILLVILNCFGWLMRGKVDWMVDEIGKIVFLLDMDFVELIEKWEIGD